MTPPTFPWKFRRITLWTTNAFCMGVISYCLWRGEDSRLYEEAIWSAFMLLGATTGSHVFGAVFEHNAITRAKGGD